MVVVTAGVKAQEIFHQDVETWLQGAPPQSSTEPARPSPPPPSRSHFYPAWETLPHEPKLPHADIISERLETLLALSSARIRGASSDQTSPLIITSVAALMQRTFPPEVLAARSRILRPGDTIDPLDLVEWLEEQGYEPEAQVTQRGEIALRGGILDVYPLTSPWPVRLEFFGNELESLRHFDPLTQISRETIARVSLPPGGEIGILKRMIDHPTHRADSDSKPTGVPGPSGWPVSAGAEPALGTLADYLPASSIFLLCEPAELEEHAELYAGQTPAGDPFFQDWSDLQRQLTDKSLTLVSINQEPSSGSVLTFYSLDAFRPVAERSAPSEIAETLRREFFHQIHRWLRQGYSVRVFCNNEGERERFSEVWDEYGLGHEPEEMGSKGSENLANPQLGSPQRLSTHLGALSRGFHCEPARIAVITDAEIFGRYKVQRPRRLKSPHARAARSALDIDFTDLEEGDYVVHLQHGIGRYCGLKVLPIGLGRKSATTSAPSSDLGQECLVIEYAAGSSDLPAPKLYVPVTEAHLVSKYVGSGKARPLLNTLGGTRWAKTKAQAEEAVRDLASELLGVQAARESQAGHAFAQDSPWQREFEGAFLYEETPDQMRSILETKRDMETPRPMDRLICGDVGYGKTEVAIRAAFKAIMGGKQVAMLVPTTILAQQHFNTFRERMADYPVRVEQLSRFCSRREQRRIVSELAEGAVDIVIGTHRLLQSDIAFKDLGLVVVDEEQRFGVLHKEKLKRLRWLVDVLTLSATPIPRTLYLALTGARDMSTIETPPQDRLPVETIVAQYDERLVRDAIQRELNREGQVFYLHNRIIDIATVAARLGALVPKARIVVGHGQMESDELEDVMAKFINGEADVLISTTIIESGIDIPNANTIIIDRADRFGLSDLYQLRGRVGRYKHQAYAYLLLPRHAALLSDVRKRISAIKQYSSLGSGFKIAMRDLEIRGAGNLLGPEQSGHITAVGFELYCQLLKQSVSALKGEKVAPRIEVQMRLDFLVMSPGDVEGERSGLGDREPQTKPKTAAREMIEIPREVAVHLGEEGVEGSDGDQDENTEATRDRARASAFIPFRYISESRQRIAMYRKLAQAADKESVATLRGEMRDRFGALPPPVERLLQVAELRILASQRGITALETKGDKLVMTRNNDLIMLAGKFPRLTQREAPARLNEIKKLVLSL